MYLMGVYHGMQPVLLSRTYVFAAFDGRWPGVAFLILALSGNFGGFPRALRSGASTRYSRVEARKETNSKALILLRTN
jgi:hypothetical protein